MANAFISGRRYPTGGGAAIPAGHQSFTANGIFTAPYTGVYTVAITAPISKGGDGTSGTVDLSNPTQGTGGSGGSKPIPTAAATCLASIVPTIPTLSLSGGNGTYSGGSIAQYNVSATFNGATGGRPSTNFGNSGGVGGEGNGVLKGSYGNYLDVYDLIATSVSACNGLPAQVGRIDITWGNS